MASEYDNLLDEALADFDEPVIKKQEDVKPKEVPIVSALESTGPEATVTKDSQNAQALAPKGLGGLSLSKKGGAKKSLPSQKAQAPKKDTSTPPDLSNLPPDVRQLAEDLFKLVEESDLSKATEGKSTAELEAEALAQLSSLGLNFDLSGADFGSGSMPEAFKSASLQGLFDQTQKTVAEHQTRGQKDDTKKSGHGGAPTNPLEALMSEMGDILGTGAGAGGLPFGNADAPGGAMNMMVEHVMRNLLSKEVLYGPLRDIREKYPPWLASHKDTLPAEEFARYEAQYRSVQQVCKQYEEAPDEFQKLVELMQEMQGHGDPPKEIVEEMTGGSGSSAGMPDLAGLRSLGL